jgi:site-specific recombinase XerD
VFQPVPEPKVEANLTVVRDLAAFLTGSTTITDWATVSTGDVEAFLATQPARAAHRLAALRRFFAFAARRRLILTSPSPESTSASPGGSAARH